MGEEGEKKERTDEAKLVIDENEKVCVQCNKSKQWNLKGTIKEFRINEKGRICSYLVQLESGLVTSRHRRFLKRDLPMNDDIVAEGDVPQAGNIPAAADVADRAWHDLAPIHCHRIQTRSKHKKANHRTNHVAVKPPYLRKFYAETATHELRHSNESAHSSDFTSLPLVAELQDALMWGGSFLQRIFSGECSD